LAVKGITFMNKKFLILVIALQILVLIFMSAEREFILLFGKNVRLRTVPVDPYDPFRGEFVALNYDISFIQLDIIKDPTIDIESFNSPFYVLLKENEDGIWDIKNCSLTKPPNSELFIRGRIDRHSYYNDKYLHLKYGIEKFFVQQGKGLEIEKKARDKGNIRIPLEVNVAIGNSGIAVAKSMEWSPIGVGVEVLERPQLRNLSGRNERNSNSEMEPPIRKSPKIKLTLKNCSEKVLGIIILPDYASFELLSSERSTKNFIFRKTLNQNIKIQDSDLKLLKPQEKIDVIFDLADPRWFVKNKKNEYVEIGDISNDSWGNMIRIRYKSPLRKECNHLKHADITWYGTLKSPNVSVSGNID